MPRRAKFLGREHNPLVLWLVPTDAIRRQTLETLQKPGHPNKETLETDFGENKVRILDIEDFADLTPQDLRDKACIVIGSFAALRVEKTEGRKFYEHKETREPHFATVPATTPGLELHSEGPEAGKIKKSCANIMALIRPLVIVDEAHNAKTELSCDVLNRVRAGCVIEFSATPATDSNVLHHVSASVLKAEAMIKLPIVLTEFPSWQEAQTDSILQRKKLEELARSEPDFVRPIVLIQAESKDREVTVEEVQKFLVEQGKIERERIAIATGTQRELDDMKLMDPACKVEFVITVQALKEGWDCPFAYVFCSVATVHSAKDVERLIERHLNTQSVFAFAEVPTNWTILELSRELDPPLRKNNIRQEVLLEFIRRTLHFLEERRKISLNTLYRVRVSLERALREKIAQYRQAAFAKGYQLRLFSDEAVVETSYKYAIDFDPDNYPATLHYNGAFQFPKHYYKGMVGEFDNNAELECAKVIEMCPRVKRWVRNVPGMFGLPLAHGTFYPDFVAELDDGRMLVVEYKGAHLIEHEQQKKNIGEKWAEKSDGKAIFLWAVKKDAEGRAVWRQLQDKIAVRNASG